MNDLQLRPAQAKILEYENGRLAISAVPGSGKTFTLSLLAAKLIGDGHFDKLSAGSIDPNQQQILIVTYLNASVDNFKVRIRQRLEAEDLPPVGFDVRTLHSLALEIVRTANSGLTEDSGPLVLDEGQGNHFLARAVDGWIEAHPAEWNQFLTDDAPQTRARWRDATQRMAKAFIRAAKNERYRPDEIVQQLEQGDTDNRSAEMPIHESPLLWMMAGIYGRYQIILDRQGTLDFDDLIWQAVELLDQRSGLAEQLCNRWPYVLEDEAQDSVPLQEALISRLTGEAGNWVRVGDPNQAITSTFTAAHPRFFNAFADRPDVTSLPLPNSGRCAPLIMGAANTLLHWVMDKHPVPEVQSSTFRRQNIEPTPPGDAQPNPPDSEADIRIRVYKHREDEELPQVAQLAVRYAQKRPEHTVAILVPTNNLGHQMAEHLDNLDADYDNLLRGGTREREIAAAMHAVLTVLADPLDTKAITAAHASLHALGHPVALLPDEELEQFHTLLRSVHQPEWLLYPYDDEVARALPAGVATETQTQTAVRFAAFLRELLALRPLPIDDLALALGDELFAWGDVHEGDLAIAYQIATLLRGWRDAQPDWRLPELVAELGNIVSGRRSLPPQQPHRLWL